jgi:Phosphotransferase enzyme family
MATTSVIRREDEVSAAWLSHILKRDVKQLEITAGRGNWSRQLAIEAHMSDGTAQALRLKICLGDTFGRSEVDYYSLDYVMLANAPLVRCFDAQYDAAIGYHLLLDDLSATHADRRDAPPTLAHGLAVAEALGRMHAHHWESMPVPDEAALNRYFEAIRPGLDAMENATGCSLRAQFELHEAAFRERWKTPRGMSLLHGDLNPTNVLTPRGSEAPVYFLDRQPFDWSLTHGVAVSDLACFMVPWWPEQTRHDCELTVLRHWHESIGKPDYSWNEAQADWKLSVEQCLHVPMEWCSKETTLHSMSWLWKSQFARVQNALSRPGGDA